MRYLAALWLNLWLVMPVFAQQDAGTLARDAGVALSAASDRLDAAETARDRVKALTKAILAYEDGLAAMRVGLRRVAIRKAQLRGQLQSRDAEIAQLLAVLQTLTPGQAPTVFLHPEGLRGTARAGMLLSELAPALNSRAQSLRKQLTDVETLQRLQEAATEQLQTGLTEVQRARTALNTAMADRTDLPVRFAEDPVRTAILIASSDTLDAFSSGLSNLSSSESAWIPPLTDDQIGALAMPARGILLRRMDEPDAAGIARPGILLATRPGALVTSPTAATLRYVGPFLDFGLLAILEPRPQTLFVMAGLGVIYGKTGQIIPAGTPLGLMGSLPTRPIEHGQSIMGEEGGTAHSETLYIEVRQNNVPQDPLEWFRADKDG